jgi:hypothetical protein
MLCMLTDFLKACDFALIIFIFRRMKNTGMTAVKIYSSRLGLIAITNVPLNIKIWYGDMSYKCVIRSSSSYE